MSKFCFCDNKKESETSMTADKIIRHKIAEFYGFQVFIDGSFEGTPTIMIDYSEDGLRDIYNLLTNTYENQSLPQSFRNVVDEWIEEHRQDLMSMWKEKKVVELPEWE